MRTTTLNNTKIQNVKFTTLAFEHLPNMKQCIFVVLLLITPFLAYSQEERSNNYFIKTTCQYGYVFQTNPFIRGANPDHEPVKAVQCVSLRFGIQSKGKSYWEKAYKNPKYGFQLKVVVRFHKVVPCTLF